MVKSLLSCVPLLLLLLVVPTAAAQDYSVEVIEGPPPADEVSGEFKALLSEKGLRVKRDGSRTVCELWLARQWNIEKDFAETQERLYPFSSGELIGVVHFSRRGKDFRDQTIGSGWYTLRFALQPIDGNHVGTSLTRDFVVMIDAAKDAADRVWDLPEMLTTSAEAAGSTHPAMLCLQKATDGAEAAVRQDETNDWWILHVMGKGAAGTESRDIPLDIVVDGHAAE